MSDLAAIAADLAAIRDERRISVAFRRATGTPPPVQDVRIERARTPAQATGEAARSVQTRGVLMGAVDLDIQIGDRLNDADGTLYRVEAIDSNRTVATFATVVRVE